MSNLEAGNENKANLTKLKVKISDKLEQVIELATDGGGGALFANGKPLIDYDMTVEKAELHEG